MDIIDLDKNTSCILCSLDYQYLDKLILTHFTRLAPKLTKEALYGTLHQFLESNKKRLEMQGRCSIQLIGQDSVAFGKASRVSRTLVY